MQLKGFRPLDRGEMSILAALVLVAVLGTAEFFFQGLAPSPVSQTAAGGTAAPSVSKEVSDAKAAQSEACRKQIQAAKANRGKSPTTVQSFKKNTTEQNKCVGAVLKTGATDKNADSSYRCTGEITVVTLDKSGQGTITSEPDTSDPPAVPAGKCLTTFCDKDSSGKPVNCSKAKLWDGVDSMQKWALSPDTFKTLSFDQKNSVLGNVSAINSTDQQYLSGLLSQNQSTAAQDAAALNKAVSDCDNSVRSAAAALALGDNCNVNAQIAQIAQANGAQCEKGGDSYVCNSASLEQAAKNAQITQEQLKQLAAAKVTLQPSACPNGGTPPDCSPQTPPCSTVGCAGPADIGSRTGIGDTFGKGGLGSLLKGLSAGRSSSGAPSLAPAQICSTDSNVYQQQQQQYQQALQQYNYQLQQYNYQLQLNASYGNSGVAPTPPSAPAACTPSTQNQCSTQPPQPSAASCSGGSWQPIYSGNCIVNWQCSNLGAQLSCQPQKADVGMQLSLSYSCAQGTASGQGFTASGSSGTSTVTVEKPPAGTNTATYALTCTSGSQTSGAQCSVQVSQPTIVLVANPSTIPSGGTSLIGWVTTGMDSCTISSPQDAAFTAQNSANTSVSGSAQTLPATATQQYLLSCQTLAGGAKSATTTVAVQ